VAVAIAQGGARYRAGDFIGALAAFERAAALDPSSVVTRYDTAAALFQLGRYSEARAQYREARERADPALRTKIDYALGNVAAALGEFGEAITWYDSCLASRVPGRAYNEIRRDARDNRAYVERKRPPNDQTETAAARPTPKTAPQPRKTPRPEQLDSSTSASQTPPDAPATKDSPRNRQPKDSSPKHVSSPAEGPSPSSGSADTQLEEALGNVRDALRRRLAAEPPPSLPDEERKDW
jgi:Ca-activated chloride channel family protein